jgi:hypothetical protein
MTPLKKYKESFRDMYGRVISTCEDIFYLNRSFSLLCKLDGAIPVVTPPLSVTHCDFLMTTMAGRPGPPGAGVDKGKFPLPYRVTPSAENHKITKYAGHSEIECVSVSLSLPYITGTV